MSIDCDEEISDFKVGDPIDLAVGYADSTVFLHRKIFAMRRGELQDVLHLPMHP